ncbi:hypothetical protein TIFTF001_019546 [Ficus carica]|uniref:Uncharacterized protein n=1 Tax=Ficus carica TaxID=3494 RepID=A0AA88AT26_FICCA|nr:hypothetical protein TIFTF001_019546 [Ficus carica]
MVATSGSRPRQVARSRVDLITETQPSVELVASWLDLVNQKPETRLNDTNLGCYKSLVMLNLAITVCPSFKIM